jgi:hypothetical protein
MTIKRVGPLSCAKIAGLIYGAAGLVVGGVVFMFAILRLAFSDAHADLTASALSRVARTAISLGAIVAFPILYGAIAFVFALIGAWLYNLVAAAVGGVEIEVE